MSKCSKRITLAQLTKDCKFSRYMGDMTFNNYGVEVYITPDDRRLLITTVNGYLLKDHYVYLTKQQYLDLPEDPYNSLVELYAGFNECGFEFN